MILDRSFSISFLQIVLGSIL
uniref:DnaJ protein homolog ANJ1-like n=1 Tax=Rhizophora mucronata TaxID=61149 RepID=A0A2P2M7F4_RHIMU